VPGACDVPALIRTGPAAARGFVSAALAEPAEGIEDARPRLVGAARRALRPILESRYIARRTAEARPDAGPEQQPGHAMQEPR
jgi:hypothetical protein